MKYLVQKIKKKERAKNESEYVKRLQQEDLPLEEVRIAGIPTQGQIQQDPSGIALEAATTLATGPIINTAKGPIMAIVNKITKNKNLEEAKEKFTKIINGKAKDLNLKELSGARMDPKNIIKPEDVKGKVSFAPDPIKNTQKVIAVGPEPKPTKMDILHSKLRKIDPKIQEAFNTKLQENVPLSTKKEFVKKIIQKYKLQIK